MMRSILIVGLATTVFLVAACGNEAASTDPVVIGGKPWTEQYILPQILGQYIEGNSEYSVSYEEGLGEVLILTPAIEDGDIDMYVEYTGTGLKDVLKEESVIGESSEEVLARVRAGYEEALDVTWLEPLGFENSYTVAFSKDSQTLSELAEITHSQPVSFGGPHSFYEREGDGYEDLVSTYEMEFSNTESFDPSIMYEAVAEGDVDVIPAFTTDSRIELFDLQTTEDNLGFFPKYDAVPIVRQETLKDYPELEDLVNELAGQISEEEMMLMNARVDQDQAIARDVARDFLFEKGLIEE
ncbi:glycine betaine ABC transporter substrate-binding protein [Planococcus sp. ISL-110]|uniref:glycine betaine ABC transporter substrate-binding protein n=1 Tax=Planococcus sp. ISL-110 TaxID=2819167 RepID=UPI0020361FE8|nr:glycine betaine ABC transporter substrate-binding protein [Planococcus sp. ISL-110]